MNTEFFKGKTLLITGGTGSFGNTVLKHFLHSNIGEIRIFSRDEKKQDDMRHEYQQLHPQLAGKLRFYIGDVRNPASVKSAVRGVDFIFHAAALKQVPSCEFFPMEAVRTNIVGTDNVLTAAIDAGVKKVVCLSTDNQIKAGKPITITDPDMTRFLMNLDEAVDLVAFAFEHARPGDLFVQKSPASTIGDLAKAVQQLFGDTGTQIIGTRHGEKLFETLMTREERVRSEDMGGYYRVSADGRDLNYDKFVVKGQVHTQADESYTSHNTRRLDVQGTVEKILTAEYVQRELANWKKA